MLGMQWEIGMQPFGVSRILTRAVSRQTCLWVVPRRGDAHVAAPDGVPYAQLTIGLPLELLAEERRTALTPTNVALLRKKGFTQVLVARGAGRRADFPDEQYEAAGASLVASDRVLADADILLKLRAPSLEQEVNKMKEGATTISFLYPQLAENAALVERLRERNITSFAMDCIKRISRAQVFDALSSMANVAGYRAVLEASTHFGRFLVGQTTAAGRIPPTKVLVIGAGVAGLSAIATAKRMGAIVRGFDARPVTKEQVESLGAEFLSITVQEDGSGSGGYAKEMSQNYLTAQHALFKQQARETEIIITTALIPGKRAPILLPREVVEAMRPGSVIVDLAAETGGNCELTKTGEVITTANGVTIIGYSQPDLASRLPTQSSTLYSNNVTKFLLSMGGPNHFRIDLNDEVVRGAIVTHKGEKLYPPPSSPQPVAATPTPGATAAHLELPKEVTLTPYQKTTREVTTLTAGMASALALGKVTTPAFMGSFFTAGLASLIGYRVVHGVVPALHSPLMSVTNAISGLVGVGAVFLLGGGYLPHTFPQIMASLALLMSFGNVAGGFTITQRMLQFFRKPSDPDDYVYLYAAPGLIFSSAFVWAAMSGAAGLAQAGYLVSSLLCIGSLAGLSSQLTARQGNALGMLGVSIGFLSSVVAAGLPAAVVTQFVALAGLGSAAGAYIGVRISPLELPQTVAALHSVVGLAAVLTSAAAVFAGATHDSLHLVIAYLGVIVGGVTFTGSVVAFGKLSGKLSSRPTILPNRHLINGGLLATNLALLSPFLSYAPTSIAIPSACLLANTGLSFAKGYTIASAVGGGDMPIIITVLNAFSGLALVSEGLMLNNNILTTAGTLIVCSGSALTLIMCRAMNRTISNVLFTGIAPAASTSKAIEGTVTQTNVEDSIDALLNAETVMIAAGYGCAVSKAQHALSEIVKLLKARGIITRFVVHPVAVNVLLAEAGVAYEDVLEMDEGNPDLPETDVCLIIGCNDVVNPISQEADSPLAGMPVIEAWKAKQVIVSKRSMASGYADVPNPLFYYPNTKMLFGDAKASCEAIQRGIEQRPTA